MQLSNEPAEALAQKLVDTSRGAFALCGFASGGPFCLLKMNCQLIPCVSGSEAMDGVIKLGRQVES